MKISNFELIKKMNKDELSVFIINHTTCSCCPCNDICEISENNGSCCDLIYDWLEDEVDVLTFGELKVGEKFLDIEDENKIAYMKTTSCKSDECNINSVDLSNGNLVWFDKDYVVIREK